PHTLLGIESDVLQNPRVAPQGTPLWRDRVGEFAPRLGASYRLGSDAPWEATIRAGVGVFYDLGMGNIATAFGTGDPYFVTRNVFNAPFPLADTVRTPPIPGVDPPGQYWLLDPNLRLPFTTQWNAAWEQRLGAVQNVTVGYVGAAGRRLLLNQYYTTTVADWPGTRIPIFVQRNLSRSRYDAFQAKYERRLHRGLQVLASYTVGRSDDNASTADSTSPPAASAAGLLAREWGPSDFDVRHQLAAAMTLELPTLDMPPAMSAITRDWGVDLLLRVQSPFPVTPVVGF